MEKSTSRLLDCVWEKPVSPSSKVPFATRETMSFHLWELVASVASKVKLVLKGEKAQ